MPVSVRLTRWKAMGLDWLALVGSKAIQSTKTAQPTKNAFQDQVKRSSE